MSVSAWGYYCTHVFVWKTTDGTDAHALKSQFSFIFCGTHTYIEVINVWSFSGLKMKLSINIKSLCKNFVFYLTIYSFLVTSSNVCICSKKGERDGRFYILLYLNQEHVTHWDLAHHLLCGPLWPVVTHNTFLCRDVCMYIWRNMIWGQHSDIHQQPSQLPSFLFSHLVFFPLITFTSFTHKYTAYLWGIRCVTSCFQRDTRCCCWERSFSSCLEGHL